jgi:probable phosphoglycerate mutase
VSASPSSTASGVGHPRPLQLQRPDGSRYPADPGAAGPGPAASRRRLLARPPTPRPPVARPCWWSATTPSCAACSARALGLPASGFRRLRLEQRLRSPCSTSARRRSPVRRGASAVPDRVAQRHRPPAPRRCAPAPAARQGPRASACCWCAMARPTGTAQGRFQGQIDIPLNGNGHAQAAAAGDFLRRVRFDRAYSSSHGPAPPDGRGHPAPPPRRAAHPA